MSDLNSILDRAKSARLAVFDVDGVLTDGRLYFSLGQEEQKAFHVHDGLGLKMLKSSGCEIAVLSSRNSGIVKDRMRELGIELILQGRADKRDTLLSVMKDLKLERHQVVYTGDDLVDIPAMDISGLAIAVANAHPMVKSFADWTTEKPGGRGAVREVCEMILSAQGRLEPLYEGFLP